MAYVLHDDVDRYAGRAERLEDRGGYAGAVAHSEHGDLRHVAFLRDAAHSLSVFHRYLGDDHRTHALVEARPHVDGHAVELADLDGPRVHHARARGRELEHLVIAYVRELAGCAHDPGIGRVDAVHV